MAESLTNKTVLVTGANGFLGSVLTRRLARDGAQVRAMVRSEAKGDALRDVAEIITGDVTDASRMHTVAAGCDYVCHVAVSFRGTEEQQRVNVTGTRNVAQAAAAAGVKRLIHVSSIAVYGYAADGVIVEEHPPTPTPNEIYSQTKATAEADVLAICQQHDLSYAIIRPGMIYGPGSGQWTDTMYKLARWAVVWPGDGSGSAFPVHVEDVADLIATMITHGGAHNEIFNCVDDIPITWRDFLLSYAALAGHQRWVAVPPVLLRVAVRLVAALVPSGNRLKAGPDALGSIFNERIIDMTKAHALLGWQPGIDLQAGIASCVPYLKAKGMLR